MSEPTNSSQPESPTALVDRLDCLLGLERRPVGVTFFKDAGEFDRSPVQLLKTALSYCTMVRIATAGYARKADAARISCPGARRALGLNPPEEEFRSGARYLSLGLYRDLDTARRTTEHIALIDAEIHGVMVQPLAGCQAPPQVVILILTPYQAMRIVQGYTYHFGPTPATSLGMQGVCAELTARPAESDGLNISLLCSNTRFSCAWTDGEVGIGLPFDRLAATVVGIAATVNATEPDARKRAILERTTDNGIRREIRLNSTYY